MLACIFEEYADIKGKLIQESPVDIVKKE